MKGYATRIKQIKELSGSEDMSDETAMLIHLAEKQESLGSGVLQKLAAMESELKLLRETVKK